VVLDVRDVRLVRSFTQALPGFLQGQRWFAGKARPIKACEVLDIVPVRSGRDAFYLFLVRVEFDGGNPQTYALPLKEISSPSEAEGIDAAGFGLKIELENHDGAKTVMFGDAPHTRDFPETLLDVIGHGDKFAGMSGELVGIPTSVFQSLRGPDSHLEARILSVEQSNTSIVYGRRLILKIFRLIAEGVNPEIEVCSFLTERTSFASFAAVAGALEYRQDGKPAVSLGVMQAFVPNQGDAWKFTLDALGSYFERLEGSTVSEAALPAEHLLELSRQEAPTAAVERIGSYVKSAELLGRRTAELHVALSSDAHDPDFSPEPFTPSYQRSLQASMIGLVQQNFELLRDRSPHLAGEDRELARLVLGREKELRARLDRVLGRKMTSMRTRVHGDYHLGQVLHTGSDFVIIDFEGEPARPLHERRMKSSPLRDVAGMLRSFHYAVYSVVFERAGGGEKQTARNRDWDAWARYWQTYVSAAFLNSYLKAATPASFLPKEPDELRLLLDVSLLEKAIYELGYELNNRPSWVRIPLEGIVQTLADQTQTTGV
jgi:maltose alpha-D-glucosyltransferase/alpha-amylase